MSVAPQRSVAAFASLARASHEVIVRYQNANGAYPACPSFSAYEGYSWLRDGGFIAEGVSRYGDVASASRFHDWVTARLAERRDAVDDLVQRAAKGEVIPASDMLPTRFAIEETGATDDWWNFQTDGYGTWLWAVITHASRHGLALDPWLDGIHVALDYAAAFWDVPCYDWWEENVTERHGSTLAAIYGGLRAAEGAEELARDSRVKASAAADRIRELVVAEGLAGPSRYLSKWLGATTVDASAASAIVPFGLLGVDSAEAAATLERVRSELDADLGVHRYLADEFFGGGQWPLLTCLVGWNDVARGDTEAAWARLEWVAAQFTASDELPEQVAHDLLNPEHRQRWIDAWGPVATPLLWSHGMFLILADELGVSG